MISVVLALMTFFDDVVQCLVSVLRDSTVSSRLSSIFRRKLGALVSHTEVKPPQAWWTNRGVYYGVVAANIEVRYSAETYAKSS